MENLPMLFSYEDTKNVFPNRKTFESFLSRSTKAKDIAQIRKGLYSLIDPSTGECMASKFQIACHLSKTSFLDGHLALEYYGLAEQSFVAVAKVFSLSRFRDSSFDGVTYQCVLTKVTAEINDRINEEGVRIATIERTLIDSCDKLEYAGGYEELTKAVSMIKYLKEDSLLSLLNLYGKNVLFLKVGYLIETYYQGKLSEAFFRQCLKHRTDKKYYFGTKKGRCAYVNKWNLLVPKEGGMMPNEI
jgi:predicted transcriptional regulator of viral defense system